MTTASAIYGRHTLYNAFQTAFKKILPEKKPLPFYRKLGLPLTLTSVFKNTPEVQVAYMLENHVVHTAASFFRIDNTVSGSAIKIPIKTPIIAATRAIIRLREVFLDV